MKKHSNKRARREAIKAKRGQVPEKVRELETEDYRLISDGRLFVKYRKELR